MIISYQISAKYLLISSITERVAVNRVSDKHNLSSIQTLLAQNTGSRPDLQTVFAGESLLSDLDPCLIPCRVGSLRDVPRSVRKDGRGGN